MLVRRVCTALTYMVIKSGCSVAGTYADYNQSKSIYLFLFVLLFFHFSHRLLVCHHLQRFLVCHHLKGRTRRLSGSTGHSAPSLAAHPAVRQQACSGPIGPPSGLRGGPTYRRPLVARRVCYDDAPSGHIFTHGRPFLGVHYC